MEIYLVTLLCRGYEVCVEVEAATKDGARRAAKVLYPDGHTVHIEKQRTYP